MAATRFRLTAWQRHIDVAGFINLKTSADGFDAPHRFEDLPQPLRGDAVHLDVDVLRIAAHQTVADPAADDERTTARVADGCGDRARALERIRHVDRAVCGQTSSRSGRRRRARPRSAAPDLAPCGTGTLPGPDASSCVRWRQPPRRRVASARGPLSSLPIRAP